MYRRAVLATAATAGVGSLAGCLGSSDSGSDAPDPVALSGTKYDYQGGMEIGVHGGPNGQIFYAEGEPQSVASPASVRTVHEDHGGNEHLAWFHTLVYGLFPYHFTRQQRGWEAEAIYATDYSSVDWTLDDGASRPVMPSPTAPETFADATALTYVGDSDAMGGMGPALHPFSDESEAESFADQYNGTLYGFEEITRPLVESLKEAGGTEM